MNALNKLLGIRADTRQADADALYRIADRTALALRLETARQLTLLRAALLTPGLYDKNLALAIPEQTRALAQFYWPLVISTNYDDLYISALGNANATILGRSPNHCENTVQSLDVSRPRILWAIQGYVGGIIPRTQLHTHSAQSFVLESDQKLLLHEIVIGHRQYQQAAAQSPAFRRTFSEVFRRRSLLFLGSGLSETYFVNLFSEVLLNYGPSSQQHYAFICNEEVDRFDIQFLRVRLGITPVSYGDDYVSLPNALKSTFTPHIYAKRNRRQAAALNALSYWIPRTSAPKAGVNLHLRLSGLRQPATGQAVVLSAGRGPGEMPVLGNMGVSFIANFRELRSGTHIHRWEAICSSRSLYRLRSEFELFPVFALIAREPKTDERDLLIIKHTTAEALDTLECLGEFEHVSMGILAAGNRIYAHPTFPFMGQLAGIHQFVSSELQTPENKSLTSLEIDIVDPSVWSPITSGRLPVRQLLSSDLVRVFVRIQYDDEHWDSFATSVPFHYKAGDVLRLYQISDESVSITIYPSAIGRKRDPLLAPIFPLMTI